MKSYLLKLSNENAPTELLGDSWNDEDILAKYLNTSTLQEFLEYATQCTGDWILCDRKQGHVITSPGFPGAFIDVSQRLISNNLNELIARRRQKGLSLLNRRVAMWWLSREIGNAINGLPISTPFTGIDFLHGCSHIAFTSASVTSNGYLSLAKAGKRSQLSFEQSLLSTCSKIRRPVSLLFSGGKDCLSIALGLRAAGIPKEDLRLKYVDARSITSACNAKKALHTAKAAGFDLEIVTPPDGWWAWSGSYATERLGRLWSTTLIEPLAPLHSVSDLSQDELLIDGQNMDAMLSMQMHKPDQGDEPRGLYWWLARAPKQLLENTHYTATFESSRAFRLGTILSKRALQALLSAAGRDLKLDTPTKLKMEVVDKISALQLRVPIGCIDDHVNCHLPIIRNEALRLTELAGDRMRDIWYYMYPSMASTLGYGYGKCTNRIPNQGPFTTLWRRNLTIKDAVTPKHEIQAFIRKHLGVSYREAIADWKDTATSLTQRMGEGNFSELEEFRHLLNPRDSAILDHLPNSNTDEILKDLKQINNIEECRQNTTKNRMERKKRFRQGLRFLNIECLIRGHH